MPRNKKVEEEKIEEVADEALESLEVESDLMESEVPEGTDTRSEAEKHYLRPGSVSGEWIFDDVPGSIAAHTLEEALEKWNELPGNLRSPGHNS